MAGLAAIHGGALGEAKAGHGGEFYTVTYYYVTLNISINRKGGSSNID